MWADRNAEFSSQKKYRQNLIYPTHATGIDLADPNCIGLKELFEDNTILHMFTGGNSNWREGTSNRGMPENIIRASGLFNPERVKNCQLLCCADGLVHIPD